MRLTQEITKGAVAVETIDVYREQIIDADKKGLHVVAVPLQTLKELIGAAEMLQELYRAMPDCEGGRLGKAISDGIPCRQDRRGG